MNGKKNWPLVVLNVLCLVALGLMMVALIWAENTSGPAEFEPPPFEAAAQWGTPQVPAELGYAPIEAQDAFTAFVCGQPAVENGRAMVYFTSPSGNTVWLKLRVLGEAGDMLGETGLLRPGQYVAEMQLAKVPADGAKVKLKIMSYESDTYRSMGAVSLNTTVAMQ